MYHLSYGTINRPLRHACGWNLLSSNLSHIFFSGEERRGLFDSVGLIGHLIANRENTRGGRRIRIYHANDCMNLIIFLHQFVYAGINPIDLKYNLKSYQRVLCFYFLYALAVTVYSIADNSIARRYEFRSFRASLPLTLSQRERKSILLSFFSSQGLHSGLYSCRAVGAQRQHCKPERSSPLPVNTHKQPIIENLSLNIPKPIFLLIFFLTMIIAFIMVENILAGPSDWEM